MSKTPLLSLKEVARYLGISVGAAKRHVNNGTIPSLRLGKRIIRVSPEDLQAMFRKRKAT